MLTSSSRRATSHTRRSLLLVGLAGVLLGAVTACSSAASVAHGGSGAPGPWASALAALDSWYTLDGRTQLELLGQIKGDVLKEIASDNAKGDARAALPLIRGEAALCGDVTKALPPPDPNLTALWKKLISACAPATADLAAAVDALDKAKLAQAEGELDAMMNLIDQVSQYLEAHVNSAK